MRKDKHLLQELLVALGVKQRDIGTFLGLSEASVSQRMSGYANWQVHEIMKLANYLYQERQVPVSLVVQAAKNVDHDEVMGKIRSLGGAR
jgi:predicted transcriptional regulator